MKNDDSSGFPVTLLTPLEIFCLLIILPKDPAITWAISHVSKTRELQNS